MGSGAMPQPKSNLLGLHFSLIDIDLMEKSIDNELASYRGVWSSLGSGQSPLPLRNRLWRNITSCAKNFNYFSELINKVIGRT